MLRKTRHLKTMAIYSAIANFGLMVGAGNSCPDHIVTRTDAIGNLLTGPDDVCATNTVPTFYYDKTFAGKSPPQAFKFKKNGNIKVQ